MSNSAFPWHRFFANDWFKATEALSLEERGALCELNAWQLAEDRALPDDAKLIGHKLRVSPRKARALLKRLIETGHIQVVAGKIQSDRAQKEREWRAEKSTKGRSSAAARWNSSDGTDMKTRSKRSENSKKQLEYREPRAANALRTECYARAKEGEGEGDTSESKRESSPPSPQTKLARGQSGDSHTQKFIRRHDDAKGFQAALETLSPLDADKALTLGFVRRLPKGGYTV